MQSQFVTIKEVLEALENHELEKHLKKKELFGVVLDAAKPKKMQQTQDFMQTVKIIDSSYGGYMTLFLFTKSIEECAPLDMIGDIVLLKRFHFQLYNGEPQARRNSYKTSQCLIFSYLDLTLKFNPNESKPLDELEKSRLLQTSEFAHIYFKNNSLLSNYWYGSLNSQIYDVLLRIIQIEQDKISLCDSSNEVYTLVSPSVAESGIQVGRVVKLRAISISTENEIKIQENSSLLELPPDCFDEKNFETIKQQIMKSDPTSEIFVQASQNSCTKVKKKWLNQPITTFDQLMNDMNPHHLIREAEIVGIYPDNIYESFVYYNKSQSFSYEQTQEEKLDITGMQSCLQLQVNLIYLKHPITLHVFRNTEFLSLEEQPNETNLDQLDQQYQRILKSIMLNENPVYGDFVVEKLRQLSTVIFRVFDTQL